MNFPLVTRVGRLVTPAVRHVVALAVAMATIVGLVATAPVASAVEVGPTGNPTVLQTNGPNNPVNNGDFYSANGLSHLLEIDVPCTWPATWPLTIDLFSSQLQTLSVNDEILGTSDTARFILTDPAGAVVVDTTYNPNNTAEAYDRLITLLPAPCGMYLLEITVSDDDQNGYKVRVGTDDDGDPNTAPPANYDDVDGIPSTGDEVTIGMTRASLQQDSGGTVCLPFYEYVQPGEASITFHNFDVDNAGAVSYYPPSSGVAFSAASLTGATVPPTAPGVIAGTTSGNSEWNNGTGTGAAAVRGGDVITAPEDGWWALVICVTDNNQFIFEGQEGIPMYFNKPTIPLVLIDKDDQLTEVSVGQQYTYVMPYENSDQTPTPMDIEEVNLIDTLPAGLTFVSCAMSNPNLTCSYDAATHTVNSYVGFMPAGTAGTFSVTVLVDASITDPVINDVALTYMAVGTNVFVLEASDTDVLVEPSDPMLTIVKDDGQTVLGQGGTTTYVIDIANNSADDAQSVMVTDPAVAGLTFDNCSVVSGPAGSTCVIDATGNLSANLGTMPAGSAAQLELNATLGATVTGDVTNTATVNWTNDVGTAQTASDDDTDTVPPPPPAPAPAPAPAPTNPMLTIVKDDGQTLLAQGGATTYVIDIANNSADAAQSVTVTDPAVPGLTFTGCSVVAGPAGSSCVIDAAGTMSANLGTMAAASTAQLHLDATVGALVTGTVTNVATVNWSNDSGETQSASDDDADLVPPPELPRTGADWITRFLAFSGLLILGGVSALRSSTGPMSRLPR